MRNPRLNVPVSNTRLPGVQLARRGVGTSGRLDGVGGAARGWRRRAPAEQPEPLEGGDRVDAAVGDPGHRLGAVDASAATT